MNNRGRHFVFYFIFFFCFWSTIPQNASKNLLPLVKILQILESKYQVHFNYIDQTVSNIIVSLPQEDLNLEETLEILRKSTNLEFIFIDDSSIVISKKVNPFSNFITQRLEEIVITDYLTQGISKKSDGKIEIESQNFGILPGLIEPDILQTIQALPGVLSVDETVSNINVRGGSHDENLILWEGIKMYQSGHFFGLVSAFNPYLTKTVNLSKNGTSVKYGDGISSVIDMRQSNVLDQGFDAGAGFNLINADAFAKVPLSKNTEIQTSIRRSITDLFLTPTYDQYSNRVFQDSDLDQNNTSAEQFYFMDASLKFLYDITDKDHLRINALTINNNLQYNKKALDESNTVYGNKLKQNNLAIGLEYLKYWNEKVTTTANIYLSTYDLNSVNFDVANNQRLLQNNNVKDFGIRINATNHIDAHLKLHGGYQFNGLIVKNIEEVNNPSYRGYSKQVNQNHSIYGEAEFTSTNEKTYARIGIRTNYIDKLFEIFTEPRLSVSHKLNNNFRLELLGELKSQTMSQIIDTQNDFLGIEKRRWVISNGNTIPLLKSKQVSFGVHYNQNKILLSAEAYFKDVEGISSRSQGFQNQYQFVNAIGSYRVKGVDFLASKQFKHLNIWLSYSYSKNDYTFKDLNDDNSFPNNLDLRHSISFASTYQINTFKLALGLNWHSGKPTTTLASTQNNSNYIIEYAAPNSSNLNDYLRADFSGTYTFKISKTTNAIFGVSIWNLLNKKNIINRYYTIDDDNDISEINNVSLGITPNVSFRINF